MAAKWTIHKTTHTGLDRGLAQAYAREVQARDSGDEVALLVPTQAAAEVARRMALEAGLPALLDARIMTFPQLAELILVANHREAREITPLQRELLIGDVLARLAEAGELGYLQATWDKPGTVAAVGAVLDEIKRGGVSSDDFPKLVATQARAHPANGPLAAVFAQYQQRLHALRLYDEPGLFWSALETLQADHREPLEDLAVLFIDGFQEFTTTQLQMLQTLAESVERIEVRLWIDEQRPHLTPRSRETLQRLQELVAPELLAEDEVAQSSGNALEQLRARLFSTTEAQLVAPDDSLQIVEAAGGMVGECRAIARRLKRLLKARPDLPPNHLAVFLRSWDTGYDTVLRQALDWYGVPADFAQGPALASVPAVQTALGVLDVVTGGWLRQDVIKLLNSNYVLPLLEGEPHLSARRLEQLALEAGIIGGALEAGDGRQTWEHGLTQLRRRLGDERTRRLELERARDLPSGSDDTGRVLEDEDGNRYRPLGQIERATAAVERAQSLVNRLAGLLAPLETAASMAVAAQAFEQTLAALQIVKTAECGLPERVALDLQGLEALSQLLRAVAESPDVLQLGATTDLQQFADRLRLACSTTRLPGTRHRRRGVQVLDLAQAGLECCTVVVVCGLRDGVFPARRHPDVFYSDATRKRLQQALPGLRPRLGDQHEDEHLLYGALAAAQEQVWLTYPYTEASGAPVLRSLYVDEVVRHWQTDAEDRPPKGLLQRRGQADVIAPLHDTFHYLEALEAIQTSGATAGGGELEQLRAIRTGELPEMTAVQALGEMETRRSSDAPPDVFAGVLAGTDLVPQLAADYGPGHTYSVSQINTYAGCPMRFFFERVLGLDAPDEPTEGLDRRDLGSLIHRILAMFFAERALGKDRCAPLTPENVSEAQADLDRCLDAACDIQAGNVFGAQDLWDRVVQRVRVDLTALLSFEASQYEADRPTVVRAVEVPFGNERSFCLVPPHGGDPVYLRGRIDRVDVMTVGDEQRWVIWDYKTYDGVGRRLVLSGADVQLAVYALSLAQLYEDGPTSSELWGYYRAARPVGRPNKVTRNAQGPDNLKAVEDTAKERIFARVAQIRAGQFECAPSDDLKPCRYCDFGSVCRISRQVK